MMINTTMPQTFDSIIKCLEGDIGDHLSLDKFSIYVVEILAFGHFLEDRKFLGSFL